MSKRTDRARGSSSNDDAITDAMAHRKIRLVALEDNPEIQRMAEHGKKFKDAREAAFDATKPYRLAMDSIIEELHSIEPTTQKVANSRRNKLEQFRALQAAIIDERQHVFEKAGFTTEDEDSSTGDGDTNRVKLEGHQPDSSPAGQEGAGGNPKLPPRAQKAWNQYQQAAEALGEDEPRDRDAYEELHKMFEQAGQFGERVDLPPLDTWQRNLRSTRSALGQQKNRPRAGRADGARSVHRQSDS